MDNIYLHLGYCKAAKLAILGITVCCTVKVNWKNVGIEDPENTKKENNNKNNNETMRKKAKG